MLDVAVTTRDDSGTGSLRNAIDSANANGNARITFSVDCGPLVLRPTSPLPPIAFSGEIDCRSQPGYAGFPIVEISGAAVDPSSGSDGLEIVSSGLTVRGVAVTDWPGSGVHVHSGRSNTLAGLYAGLRLDGLTAGGNGRNGVFLDYASTDNRIGVAGSEGLVVCSWNKMYGVCTREAHRVMVINTRIGTDANGRSAAQNEASGIVLFNTFDAVVGGCGDEPTVISGNKRYGIEFAGEATRHCRLIGAHIGCDVAGLEALPNGRSGVLIYNAGENTIGGEGPQDGNIISGNKRSAINIDGSTNEGVITDYAGRGHARLNVVINNLIGVDRTGEKALPNQLRNILINHAQDSDIRGNVIGGTGGDGVMVLGLEDDSDVLIVPARNRLRGNLIGVSRSGTPLPIGRHGVYVQHGRDTVVGGSEASDANTIRHCAKRGVTFRGIGWDTNVLMPGNAISDNGQGAYHAAP